MKRKLPEIVLIILLALTVITIGVIAVASMSNNNAMAYNEHSHNIKVMGYDKMETDMYYHTTHYACIECDYKYDAKEKCNITNFEEQDEKYHISQCDKCHEVYQLPHVDNDKDGICDDCSYVIGANNKPDDGHTHNIKVMSYDKMETNMYYHTTHYACIECDYKYEIMEKCNIANFEKQDEKYHIGQCDKCYEVYQLPHVDKDKDGICDDCSYVIGANNKPDDGHTHNIKVVGYDKMETDMYYHTTHYACIECDYKYDAKEKCNITNFEKQDEKYHIGQCDKCHEVYQLSHLDKDKDGICDDCSYVIDANNKPVDPEINITSEKYKITDAHISNTQPKTSVSEFKTNIKTNGTYINIYDKNNQLVSDNTKIGTGMKIEIKNGDKTKYFTIIVNGDVNGDGEIDLNDIVKINMARLNKLSLDEKNSLAADVTGDGTVDFSDIVKINRFRLNKVKEL